MKVTDVKTYIANAGWRNFVFVQVETDDGIHGVGEATFLWQPLAAEAAVHQLARRYVTGRSPFDIEDIWQLVYRNEWVRPEPIVMSALGGLEMALWDIVGKALGQPIYNLLGGRVRREVAAYANGWWNGDRRPAVFAEQAHAVKGKGYQALKLDPFVEGREMSPAELVLTVDIIRAVRDSIGMDMHLLVECHGRFSPGQAIEVERLLEPFSPYWLEEPTDPENIGALEEVARRTRTRIATGERCFGKYQTAELLRRNIVDVIQTDIIWSGGILETKKIAAMADANYVQYAPHNPWGPVAEMAAVQLAACTTNFLFMESFTEFDVSWRNQLVDGASQVVHGNYQIPTAPGLGIELNLEAIKEHPFDETAFQNIWQPGWSYSST